MRRLAGGGSRRQRWRSYAQTAALFCLLCAWLLPATASAAPPPNDAFIDAIELLGNSPSVAGTTVEATSEVGEPDHAGDSGGTSVWYRWTPNRSGLVRLGCESGFETLLAVYRGPSVASLTEVGADHSGAQCAPPDLYFRAVAGAEYRIAVDAASGGGGGDFAVELENTSTIPVNDDFAARTPMQDLGGNAFVLGTTEGAGREVGEPAHGGSSIGSSVWFTWTAHRSGPTRIYPCHGSFHPVIEIFAGSHLPALTSVGSPQDVGDADHLCSLGNRGGVSFPATAGETYAIAVDGTNGEWGSFELKLLEAPLSFGPRPPETFIRKQIKLSGGSAKILFAVRGGPGIGVHYLCKLDRQRFRRCGSPKTYRGLAVGRHRFAVVAIDESGVWDPTPAIRHFRIVKTGRGR